MSETTILIAEDHTLVRAGIRALLEKLDGVRVIGDVSDGLEAVRFCSEHPPDVLLMDISMPGLNGLEAAQRIMTDQPDIRILILSMYADEAYMNQAMKAGAAGYLLKGATTDEFKLAIATVCRGETYLTPAMTKYLIDCRRQGINPGEGPLAKLSSRQREVLQLIAEGHSVKDIASRLDLSVRTVETHRAQLMSRLDIHDVAGLVRLAVRTGLVSAES
jgi:DNA-binding NarL/FixJ family response regulator